jgi:hypothetical protein
VFPNQRGSKNGRILRCEFRRMLALSSFRGLARLAIPLRRVIG